MDVPSTIVNAPFELFVVVLFIYGRSPRNEDDTAFIYWMISIERAVPFTIVESINDNESDFQCISFIVFDLL